MQEKDIKKAVQEGYGRIAKGQQTGCGCGSGCCGTGPKTISKQIGYSDAEMNSVPDGANLGLGCGNPVALASLKGGETVLDLGSGAGFDSFLAAQRVGPTGRVIGVDMTVEMVRKARENARKGNYTNVEFRLGEIEELPVSAGTVDVIISNCVINLSPDKPKVFREAYRVLKPGGRLMVSDMVLLKDLPENIKSSVAAYVGCLAGALKKDDYLGAIQTAGFREVKVIDEIPYPLEAMVDDPTAKELVQEMNLTPETLQKIGQAVVSIKVTGIKAK